MHRLFGQEEGKHDRQQGHHDGRRLGPQVIQRRVFASGVLPGGPVRDL